ncbi:DUF2188 domain-containing protein [Xanthobacter autotrophicus]|uniref:DUF2188 domain-containing protein n=1 Tax=Xanthobacter autotrophicus TaxID=280 RepID=UPI0037291A3E
MSGKNQHVVPHEEGWAVRGEGNQRVASIHPTQREAIDAARDIARNQGSEMLIHGENGVNVLSACFRRSRKRGPKGNVRTVFRHGRLGLTHF